MTALYVETSALVRALDGSDTAVASAMREATDLVTSALTGLEAARAIARLRRDGHLSPAGERDSLRRLAEFERSAGTRSIDDLRPAIDRAAPLTEYAWRFRYPGTPAPCASI